MALLTKSVYVQLCDIVGDALDHPRPAITEVGSKCAWPVGVYALGHRHPGSGRLMIDYVGSSVRIKGDMSNRIREHLRHPGKAGRFTCQVIIPLKLDTTVSETRRLEGRVARALGVPCWCERIPGGRRR
jgi:hypothetical protein